MSEMKIEVKGIKELRRELKKIDDKLPKELKDALVKASTIVVDRARSKVPQRDGDAAGSLKVKKLGAAAAIGAGGDKAPYYPWLDFGGTVGKGRTGRGGTASAIARGGTGVGTAGSVVRPFKKSGRYIYPALAEKRHEVTGIVDAALAELARKAGFEQHGRSDG